MSKRTPDEGRYSKVTRRMWNDEKFRALSKPPPNAQTLWKRLLTGPELGAVPGLYAARLVGIADALEWPQAETEACWLEIADQDMAKADWRAGIVWVPNAFFHNEPESPNVVVGWRLALRELPECALKREAIACLRGYLEAKGKAWLRAFQEACGEVAPKPSGKPRRKAVTKPSGEAPPHPSDNQEQEQEQEQDSGAGDSDPPQGTRGRDRFMASFETEHPGAIELTDAHRDLCRARGLDLENEIGKHRAWAKSHGRRVLDWGADLELWLRGSKHQPRPLAVVGPANESRAERQTRQQLERVAELEAEERAAQGAPA